MVGGTTHGHGDGSKGRPDGWGRLPELQAGSVLAADTDSMALQQLIHKGTQKMVDLVHRRLFWTRNDHSEVNIFWLEAQGGREVIVDEVDCTNGVGFPSLT